MKMNKIRIARATVDCKESQIILTIDPDGRKMCMTMAEFDNDNMAEVIVADDGFIVSKDELGYEDYDEKHKEMFNKQELGEALTTSPTSH